MVALSVAWNRKKVPVASPVAGLFLIDRIWAQISREESRLQISKSCTVYGYGYGYGYGLGLFFIPGMRRIRNTAWLGCGIHTRLQTLGNRGTAARHTAARSSTPWLREPFEGPTLGHSGAPSHSAFVLFIAERTPLASSRCSFMFPLINLP